MRQPTTDELLLARDLKKDMYDLLFWLTIDALPDVAKAFKAADYKWDKLPPEEQEICKAADTIAKAHLKRREAWAAWPELA